MGKPLLRPLESIPRPRQVPNRHPTLRTRFLALQTRFRGVEGDLLVEERAIRLESTKRRERAMRQESTKQHERAMNGRAGAERRLADSLSGLHFGAGPSF